MFAGKINEHVFCLRALDWNRNRLFQITGLKIKRKRGHHPITHTGFSETSKSFMLDWFNDGLLLPGYVQVSMLNSLEFG